MKKRRGVNDYTSKALSSLFSLIHSFCNKISVFFAILASIKKIFIALIPRNTYVLLKSL
jgi:hypothetical protein